MEIMELNIKHFGKFLEHKVNFQPGVNIIYGGNETGKSTIHAFIRAMFFGIVALVRLVQSLNASNAIVLMFSPKVRSFKLVQPSKAEMPISSAL